MFSKKLSSYPYFRDLSIIDVVLGSALSLQGALNLLLSDVTYDGSKIYLLTDNSEVNVSNAFDAFWDSRQKYFPGCKYLFATNQGTRLNLGKYRKGVKARLSSIGLPEASPHPRKITLDQLEKLREQRFNYQRQKIQNALASILLGYYGLRPSEVAKLAVSDFDFGFMTITLNNTKTNRNYETLPLVEPISNYVQKYITHLEPSEQNLFVRRSGEAWSRKNVTKALKEFALEIGIKSHIHSRKLRASYGKVLADLNLPPHIAAQLMRHKDPATWLRHYAQVYQKEARDIYKHSVAAFLCQLTHKDSSCHE